MNDTPQQWDDAYVAAPPWDIGRPQAAFVGLAAAGKLTGRVLDVGCGTGENTLLAAKSGATATGIDISPRAIAKARSKAAERGIDASFDVGDAMHLAELGERFDVVIDSGVFHSFDDDERARYVASLAGVIHQGGTYYALCFSDATPGDWGPRRIGRDEFYQAFAEGWTVEAIEATEFEITEGHPIEHAYAWLATIVRS
jgi:SAM-dependent methyltransferase